MLIGIDPLLTPELLMHLCAIGHGEWVAVVDANFTADLLAQGRPVVRLPGHSLERVSRAVLSVFPLAVDVDPPAAYMQVCHSPAGYRTAAQEALAALVAQAMERFDFYERAKDASLIVQSGEVTAYGNALFCKGVILP